MADPDHPRPPRHPAAGRGTLLALLACAVTAASGSNAHEAATPLLEVRIDRARVLEKHMLGFGVEWEYEGDKPEWNVENAVWLKHWPEVLKRVDFMRPGILRVMHDARMYGRMENGAYVLDVESPRTRALYRILDHAKARGIPVVLGEWWLPPELSAAFGGITGDGWADQAIIPLLLHLRNKRGYDNIRWFNLMNEPGASVSFEDWKAAILRLHAALQKAGLDEAIRIAGTDGPGDWNGWIGKTAGDPELRQAIGAYEYHLYAHLHDDKWLPSLLEGRLETGELRVKRELVSRLDPDGARKPFFMGEAGIDDGNQGDNQTNRGRFEYGVWMADYAAQSIRAGQAGLIAWCLDDAMHGWGSHGPLGLKGWGFWNSLAGWQGYPEDEFKPRPAFYAWSLVCRLFPAGSSSFECPPSGDSAVRIAAAKPPEGGLSLMVVNQASTPREVEIIVPDMGITDLSEYRYQRDGRPEDADGFPRSAAFHSGVPLSGGLKIEVPGPGVVFLSTMPATTAVTTPNP